MARPREGSDTRWRFFVWDADATFASTESTFERVVTGGSLPGQILANLLQNAQYRTYFAAQAERHLAGVLATASVRERLAAVAAELRPEMAAEAVRWRPTQKPAAAVAQWEAALQRLADSLDTSAEQLRALSNPETLRQQFPQLSVSGYPDAVATATTGYPDCTAGASPRRAYAG